MQEQSPRENYVRVIQGYLADTKQYPPKNLQQEHAWAPMAVLGGGRFLMGEVPL
jgi:hypothetical protein